MKITVSGKNMHLKDSTRDMVLQKLEKFEKYFGSDVTVKATLSHIKTTQTAEITMFLKNGVILRSESSDEIMEVALDKVIDRLFRQLKKHKTNLQKHFRQNESIRYEDIPNFLDSDKYHENEGNEKIVRSKSFPIKPMHPEEAVLQMDMLHHDFFVFLNALTDEINVVYHRKDGDFGLIEPAL